MNPQAVHETIGHDVAKGVARLLAAAADLPGMAGTNVPPGADGWLRDAYAPLFARYVAHVQWAVGLALPWWDAIVRNRMLRGEDKVAAVRSSYLLRPAGPASRPEVVWVVRSYWLECARTGARATADRQVAPAVFLLRWLVDSGHDLPVQVLSGMPYWPIGLDENGEFC